MPYNVLDPSVAQAAPVVTFAAPLTSVGETKASFITELNLQLGSRTDFDATRAAKWLNWGYRNTAAMLDISQLYASFGLNMVVGQYLYLLPRAVMYIKGAAISDTYAYPEGGRAVLGTDLKTYRKLDAIPQSRVQYFFRFNQMFVAWPTPSEIHTVALDIKMRPDDLVADTDSPLLPIEFHEAILLSARYRALRSLKLYKEAMVAQNDFIATIRPIQDADAEERITIDAHVQPAMSQRQLYRAGNGYRRFYRRDY